MIYSNMIPEMVNARQGAAVALDLKSRLPAVKGGSFEDILANEQIFASGNQWHHVRFAYMV